MKVTQCKESKNKKINQFIMGDMNKYNPIIYHSSTTNVLDGDRKSFKGADFRAIS